jgi:hypothetical protein
MSEDLGHLIDEDFEAIERIMEGGLDRQHGEHILGLVNHANEQRQPDPLLGLLEKAHQAKAEPPDNAACV